MNKQETLWQAADAAIHRPNAKPRGPSECEAIEAAVMMRYPAELVSPGVAAGAEAAALAAGASLTSLWSSAPLGLCEVE